MREIEVKVRCENLKEIEKKLIELNCELSAPIRQHDFIYSFGDSTIEWETSKEGHIVMRLRRDDHGAVFNLKQQRSNELDNLEYETKVQDPDSLHKILLTIGYKPKVEVKKVRRKGRLGEYEICLDEVEGLGGFVELEKLAADDANPEGIQEELLLKLESLSLSRKNQETRGYDTQIYFLRKKRIK